ncbi:MAG: PspC domain-containing protein [Patescibacteria group bacterium]|nr:PspC domain-containing protein [Patescibacteria group bacterium]MCL5262057.1 PspC domain-containing protein [Patescibacteria group bacterium]
MSEKIKKLYRSRTNRMIFGVCGGLGEYFEIDPVVFRLLFVALAFAGSGVPIYLVAAVIMPLNPRERERSSPAEEG